MTVLIPTQYKQEKWILILFLHSTTDAEKHSKKQGVDKSENLNHFIEWPVNTSTKKLSKSIKINFKKLLGFQFQNDNVG